MKSTSLALLGLAACAAFMAGCNKGDDKSQTPEEKQKSANAVDAPQNLRQLKELKKTDLVVGKGAPVKSGDTVYMTYTGKLKNGMLFDTNDKPDGSPYPFVLGTGSVINGWHLGIDGMRVGGKRHLEIPNKFAYGDQAQGDKVPPGADLYFDVELVDVVRQGEEELFDKTDTKVGTGREVKMGDLVDVNYQMFLCNKRKIDEFMDPKKPVTFRIGPKKAEGDREAPRGVYAAMIGMREGGVRHMRIPPVIGFAMTANPKVPGNSIVYIDMTLLKVH